MVAGEFALDHGSVVGAAVRVEHRQTGLERFI
jgi:hypothetical protein